MDGSKWPSAKEWRDRAEEYRQFADEAETEPAREAYLDVARNCEQIAERIERFEVRALARGAGN